MVPFLEGGMQWDFFLHMLVRSILLYFAIFICIRLNKKIMGLRNPFNFITYVMLGSMIATAITSVGSIWPFLTIIVVVLLFNAFTVYLVSRFPAFEQFIAGKPVVLVEHGKIQWLALKNNYITRTELREELEEQLNTNDFSKVEYAYMVGDGSIKFVVKKQQDQLTGTEK